ncbi:hypothetical protein BGZ60DRAFT_153161 [Tricladium varicosporioides]|nr:hypothetical protein BGZ60DRAFT_153161 [Hymenoscyphus varicosporioides]
MVYTETLPPAWNSKPMRTYHGWTSKATPQQVAMIEAPNNKDPLRLPDTFSHEHGIPVEHFVYDRGHYGYDILNRMYIHIMRISSVKLLRTCKQIEAEAAEILYGRNTFCFDTSYGYNSDFPTGFHSQNDFEEAPHRIPGGWCRDGKPPTPLQTKIALDRLFDKQVYQPRLLRRDPVLRFFRQIGKKNASMVRNLNIAGYFKTTPVSFTNLLSIYTLVINDVCLNLNKVVLHCYDGLPQWDDDEYGQIDEWKIDRAVKNLVLGLPRLRELQLGDYYKPYAGDQWGKSVKWIDMVKDQDALNVLRQERKDKGEAKQEKLVELALPRTPTQESEAPRRWSTAWQTTTVSPLVLGKRSSRATLR